VNLRITLIAAAFAILCHSRSFNSASIVSFRDWGILIGFPELLIAENGKPGHGSIGRIKQLTIDLPLERIDIHGQSPCN
jgi:hypothetical protein